MKEKITSTCRNVLKAVSVFPWGGGESVKINVLEWGEATAHENRVADVSRGRGDVRSDRGTCVGVKQT